MVLASCTNDSTRKAPPHISPKPARGNKTPSDFQKEEYRWTKKTLSTLLMKPKRKSKGAFKETKINAILHCP